MSIRFHLSFWDLIYATRYFARRSPIIWFSVLILFLSIYNSGSTVIWKGTWIKGIIMLF
jgi:hypothetical protein